MNSNKKNIAIRVREYKRFFTCPITVNISISQLLDVLLFTALIVTMRQQKQQEISKTKLLQKIKTLKQKQNI